MGEKQNLVMVNIQKYFGWSNRTPTEPLDWED